MDRTRTTFALAALALSLIAACGARKDPVLALLDDLEAAAEDKDAEAIRDHLAEDFGGQGGIGRAEAYAQMRRYFAAYETIGLDVYDVSVRRGEGGADVTFRVELSGRARSIGGLDGLLPPGALYRFDLHVVERPGGWKIQRAGWEETTTPSPEG